MSDIKIDPDLFQKFMNDFNTKKFLVELMIGVIDRQKKEKKTN